MILDDDIFTGLGDAIARRRAEIARCDREIRAAETQPEGARASLVTMGIEDWRVERSLIREEWWAFLGIAAIIIATGVTVVCGGFAP